VFSSDALMAAATLADTDWGGVRIWGKRASAVWLKVNRQPVPSGSLKIVGVFSSDAWIAAATLADTDSRGAGGVLKIWETIMGVLEYIRAVWLEIYRRCVFL